MLSKGDNDFRTKIWTSADSSNRYMYSTDLLLVSLDSDSDISKELYRLCALMFFKTLNWNTEVHISNSASTAVTELKTFLFQF